MSGYPHKSAWREPPHGVAILALSPESSSAFNGLELYYQAATVRSCALSVDAEELPLQSNLQVSRDAQILPADKQRLLVCTRILIERLLLRIDRLSILP